MQDPGTHSYALKDGETRDDEYLKKQVDYTIASCVGTRKRKIREAYRIRNGEMPMEEYAFLREGSGVEMPSDVRHVPVLKSMFDVLQGDEAMQPLPWHITCNDSESIGHILRERHTVFMQELERILSNSVNEMVREVNQSRSDLSPIKTQGGKPDFAAHQESYRQYKTFLEIYAQKVLDSEIPANDMRFRFNVMFNDLLCSGAEYYQSKVVGENIPPMFREINPEGLYYVKTHNTHFIRDCPRAVYVEEMSAVEIFVRWGHKLSAKDREYFMKTYGRGIAAPEETRLIASEGGLVEGELTDYAVKMLRDDLVKVYWVEWKENTRMTSEIDDEITVGRKKKKVRDSLTKYRLDRYEGVRIGERIYVDMGRSNYVIRSSRKPWDAPLTFNGACYNDRNGEPFSLVMATKDLAMKIDIMHYFLENLVAVSGTKAIPVSFPDIPVWLASDPVERVQRWLGHVKKGAVLFDLSQDGSGKFQNYTTYDLTLSNSIVTLEKIILLLEDTAAKITGVPRHRLGQMLQKDGKGVTENAIEQSTVVTQPMLQIHNTVMRMALSDHLNHCRFAYKEGYPGLFALGSYGKEIFTKAHEKFTLADLDVHISDSSETVKAIEEVKALSRELALSMKVNPAFLFDLAGNRSLTQVRELAKQAFESGAQAEIDSLTSQLNEANNQLQQYYAELSRLKESDAGLKSRELELKTRDSEERNRLEWTRRRDEKELGLKKLENDGKRIQLEHLQLAYEPGAREIKDG